MRGTGVTGSRVHDRLVLKENSTDSVPMIVQQELSLSRALFASLGQREAWRRAEGTGHQFPWWLPAPGSPHNAWAPPSGIQSRALLFTCAVSLDKTLQFFQF